MKTINRSITAIAEIGPKVAAAIGAVVLFALAASTAHAQTPPAPDMAGPIRMVGTPSGILVGDYVGQSVLLLNPATLAVENTIPLTSKPLSVAWMNGRVYVGDERAGVIEVYEKVRVKKKDSKGPGKNKKKYEWIQITSDLTASAVPQPSDIAVDESLGLIFVASKINKMVSVFDDTGALVRTIGAAGSAAPLMRPQGLALDLVGKRLFVSDDSMDEFCSGWFSCAPGAVIVYDYDGNLLGGIPSDDQVPAFKFGRAQGLTVDLTGSVYVVDSFRSEVLKFEETAPNSWTALGRFGTKGAGVKQLLLPMDVLVDEETSRIYVTSAMTARVEVFTPADMVP